MIYFISDLHLNHSKVIQFERTQFSSIEKHNETIKNNLFSLKENDELWVLGDLGFSFEWIAELKCKKYLILGNHDKYTVSHYKQYFDEVYNHPVWLSPRICLSHYPERVDKDVVNVHGHLHNSKLDLPNYINVNAAVIDYKPLSKKFVDALVMKIQKDKLKYKFGYEWWVEHQVYKLDIPEEYKPPLTEDGHVKISELRKKTKI